ncbi:MAG: hypothetical protein F6K41_12665 [Symploca sp. SIO3E6]|nr:hypothetical protein [Caldora sp. SIO3E6]
MGIGNWELGIVGWVERSETQHKLLLARKTLIPPASCLLPPASCLLPPAF